MNRSRTLLQAFAFKALVLGIIGAAMAVPMSEARAATTDPMNSMYIFPGARDDGSAGGAGVATVVHCTSFSFTSETLQFVARGLSGSFKAIMTIIIPSTGNITASTHDTIVFAEDVTLNSGLLDQGSISVAATNRNIVCTAQVVDAASTKPVGIGLQGIRFNPVPGTLE